MQGPPPRPGVQPGVSPQVAGLAPAIGGGVATRPQLPQNAAQLQALMRQNPALAQQYQLQVAAQQQQRMAAAAAGQPSAPGLAAAGRRPPSAAPTGKQAAVAAAVPRPDSAGGVAKKPSAGHAPSSGGRKRKAERIDRGDVALAAESALFAAAVEQERRADMMLARKHNELREMYASFRRGAPGTPEAAGAMRKKLRVYVFHRYNPGMPAAASGGGGDAAAGAAEPPSWQLTLSGRLLTKKDDQGTASTGAGAPPGDDGLKVKHEPFTHYLRAIEVEICDPAVPEAQRRRVWRKECHSGEQRDGVEVRGLGATPFTAKIALQLDYATPQYQLDPKLASALGLRRMHSLPWIVQALFAWIKNRGLFEQGEEAEVKVDEALREVFSLAPDVARLGWDALQARLRPLLRAPEPIRIEYQVTMEGRSPSHPQCYDLDFEVPLSAELPPYASHTTAPEKEAAEQDVMLGAVLSKMTEHRRRHDFYLAFAQDPTGFIQQVVAAQARELRVASMREGEVLEVVSAGDVWREKWAEEAVMRYLAKLANPNAAHI